MAAVVLAKYSSVRRKKKQSKSYIISMSVLHTYVLLFISGINFAIDDIITLGITLSRSSRIFITAKSVYCVNDVAKFAYWSYNIYKHPLWGGSGVYVTQSLSDTGVSLNYAVAVSLSPGHPGFLYGRCLQTTCGRLFVYAGHCPVSMHNNASRRHINL